MFANTTSPSLNKVIGFIALVGVSVALFITPLFTFAQENDTSGQLTIREQLISKALQLTERIIATVTNLPRVAGDRDVVPEIHISLPKTGLYPNDKWIEVEANVVNSKDFPKGCAYMWYLYPLPGQRPSSFMLDVKSSQIDGKLTKRFLAKEQQGFPWQNDTAIYKLGVEGVCGIDERNFKNFKHVSDKFLMFTEDEPSNVSVTVDSRAYSTTTPVIVGTAKGISTLGISIASPSGDKVYGIGNEIRVTNGKWQHRVTSPLIASDGHYLVQVYAKNKLVGFGTIKINSAGTPSPSPVGSVDLKIAGSDGPINRSAVAWSGNVSWETSGVSGCQLLNSGDGSAVKVPNNGSKNITVSAGAPSVTLLCRSDANDGGVSDSVEFVWSDLIVLYANPQHISRGEKTTVTWAIRRDSTYQNYRCQLGYGSTKKDVALSSALTGFQVFTPSQDASYTLSCTDLYGKTHEASTKVTVW